jgi:hypothetical protein
MPEDGKSLNLARVGGVIQEINCLIETCICRRITLGSLWHDSCYFFCFNPFILKRIQDYSLWLINQFELFANLLFIYVNILSKWCILIYHFGKIVLS